MTCCPRCKREICFIQNSTYGGTVTFYHWCVDQYAVVRENGLVAIGTGKHREDQLTQGERMMSLMTRLQNLNIVRLQLDEAVELSAMAETLRESYKKHQLGSPEWLDDAIRTLDRFIADQTRDRMEMELRELAQADANDMTAGERRDARKARRTELETRLGKTTEPAKV